MQRDDDKADDDLLGDDFAKAVEVDDRVVADAPTVLPVDLDDALACESSSITVLPNGQPVAVWRLPHITVSVSTNSSEAVYNGKAYTIKSGQAAFLLLGIVEAKGQIVTAKEIEAKHDVFNASHSDRAMKQLPCELQVLIESRPGKGYRLLPLA